MNAFYLLVHSLNSGDYHFSLISTPKCSLTHPAPLGLDAMVQTWPRIRLYAFPPIALLPGVLERVCRDQVLLLLIAPRWPGRVWFPDLISHLGGPVRRDLLSQAGGSIFHPQPELLKQWAWPLKGPQLIESGLPTEVVENILHSRAPSTRKLYALKWKVFTSWCSDHQLDPVNCPVGTVLEFLQDRFTAGIALSTLKVSVAAISAYHIPSGGMSLGIGKGTFGYDCNLGSLKRSYLICACGRLAQTLS